MTTPNAASVPIERAHFITHFGEPITPVEYQHFRFSIAGVKRRRFNAVTMPSKSGVAAVDTLRRYHRC